MDGERRKSPRLSLNQCIQISFGKETYIDAEAVNISENGILCSSSETVESLDRIFLMIDLPFGDQTKTIQCEGIPLHTKHEAGKTFFGVQFTDINPFSKAILAQYLENNR